MTNTDKAWRFIQTDRHYARKCKQAGLKVISFDTEDGQGPAYEVWATQEEMDHAFSRH